MKAISPGKLAIVLALVSASIALSGCTAFQSNRESAATTLPPGTPKYTVEFRDQGSKPQRKDFPLTDTTYIDQALEHANAKDRFSDLNVSVVRSLPNQRQLVMKVAYEKSAHSVAPENDYAIHPGDRIIVSDASSGMLDQMLGTLTAPLGNVPMLK